MLSKALLVPERKRTLKPPFAWIDRNFLFKGFLAELRPVENLLYFFLVLVADRDGLSFYSYDKICQLLSLAVDSYIEARNGLIDKNLIAFDGQRFQVLALPAAAPRPVPSPNTRLRTAPEAQSLAQIFAQISQGMATDSRGTKLSTGCEEAQNPSTKFFANHS